ncbi:hypothetical protein B1813_14655 [Saccharomonospora piscinae]|uniref:DUF2357 domain-containing protein n=1 Tax=Saccharomonospora piscinae TaxID=687388 RepID=A0A1V9A0V8_SACPI|nr:DUF2357 domain-containing protein [Saccharomonospora piscinae]OQO90769.1 hypothetical protein B1813_14655 [Saccharomonospora piscinae]
MSRAGSKPALKHLDPSLIRDVQPIPGNDSVLSGHINFRSQVGDSRFVVGEGEYAMEVVVEVRPTKLDYRTDYEDLLEAVGGLARQLVLEFLRATTTAAIAQHGQDTLRVEWLLLLRSEITSLEHALGFIEWNPHKRLSRESHVLPSGSIRRPTTITRRAIARGRGEGEWVTSTGIGRHRSRLPASAPFETTDNGENRWIRQQLERAVTALSLLRQFFEEIRGRRAGQKTPSRSDAIVNELRSMEEAISPFLSRSPFAEASGSVPPSFASLTLQGRPGYREAYQSLMRLNMALTVGGEALNVPVRDLSALYEIWCFLAVVQQVSRALDLVVDVTDLVELRDNGIRLSVAPGFPSTIQLQGDSGYASVSYNREFRMLSGLQKPDIVIELVRDGMPPVLLLLDAKYRVVTTPEYVESFGCPGPPTDAVGQLHRYRDAIIVRYPKYGRGRPVVRAAALFPLSADHAELWSHHPYYRSIEEVGIGALPFLPTNTSMVASWVREALEATPETLAWPGPDFIAWSQFRARDGH